MRRALEAVPLLELRRKLRQSYWFLPLLMLAGAALLAAATLRLDRWLGAGPLEPAVLSWVQIGSHDGARTILAALAGTVMTVAGVVFSVTMAVLALTTSQFGPRLLRVFVRDRGIQAVLGTFLATFLHTLLVALAVGAEGDPLPRASILTSAGLTVLSLLAFVYFVHHVSTRVQADQVVASAAHDLDAVIDGVYAPPGDGWVECAEQLPASFEDRARPVPSPIDGYVAAVDVLRLIAVASRHDLVLRLDDSPGAFAARGVPLVSAFPPERLSPAARDAIAACFYFATSRTPEQDLEFAVEQLSEIAVRAMSPAINDPYTAVRCLDRLEAGLRRLCRGTPPPSHHADAQGALRLVVRWASTADAIRAGINPVCDAGRRSVLVLEAVLGVIERLAPCSPDAAAGEALAHELTAARECIAQLDPSDRARLEPLAERAAREVAGARERLDTPVRPGAPRDVVGARC